MKGQQRINGAGHRNIGALRVVWAFTLGTFLSACYKSVPVSQPLQMQPGTVVQIRLNLEGTRQLERELGPEVRSVSGRLESVRGDTLFLALQESRTLNGQILTSSGNRVAIARPLISEASERVRNKRNSLLLTISAVVGAVLLIGSATGAIGGGGGSGTTPPPPPPA